MGTLWAQKLLTSCYAGGLSPFNIEFLFWDESFLLFPGSLASYLTPSSSTVVGKFFILSFLSLFPATVGSKDCLPVPILKAEAMTSQSMDNPALKHEHEHAWCIAKPSAHGACRIHTGLSHSSPSWWNYQSPVASCLSYLEISLFLVCSSPWAPLVPLLLAIAYKLSRDQQSQWTNCLTHTIITGKGTAERPLNFRRWPGIQTTALHSASWCEAC